LRRLKLVASYVVFNEARLISESLRSVKAYVDRYVIVDSAFTSNPIDATHSTDTTRKVCERVCHPVPLTYLESSRKLTEQAARNTYLTQVQDDDWILWLDGDEVLYGNHKDALALFNQIRDGTVRDCVSILVYTSAVFFHGLGVDMPATAYCLNPLITTTGFMTKLYQKRKGYHHKDQADVLEHAVYDAEDQLVTNGVNNRVSNIFAINHHTRQSHKEYVEDCVRALAQRRN
jgi:glycosyltransferase involved in cell wall biosynthesis